MKATFSTLIFLSNKKTIFIQFFLIPIINVLYINGLQSQFNSEFSPELAVTAVVTSLIVSIMLNINSSIVYEANNQIDNYVLAESKFNCYFWTTKVMAIILLAYVFLLLNTSLLLLFKIDTVLLYRILVTSPLYICFAIIIGLAISLASQKYNNPYFWVNILSVFSIIFFGGLGSFTLYPPVIKLSTYIFPFAGLMHYIILGDAKYILFDVVISLAWCILLLFIYKNYINFKSEGKQSSIL